MIRVRIDSKTFGEASVLGPINFEVAAGETVALVGPSGIGKSTLLRLVAGTDTQFQGCITRPDAMAFVFQEPTLLPWRSVLDNLLLVHPNLSSSAAKIALEQVGLGDKAQAFPGQLSLGQQRRLSLARAFSGAPKLLILDEPFASLDEATLQNMMQLTEELIAQHGPATLFVTHSADEAKRLADRTLTLRPSRLGARLG